MKGARAHLRCSGGALHERGDVLGGRFGILMLWAVPGGILLLGAAWIAFVFFRGNRPQPEKLSREEEQKLAELTKNYQDLTKL